MRSTLILALAGTSLAFPAIFRRRVFTETVWVEVYSTVTVPYGSSPTSSLPLQAQQNAVAVAAPQVTPDAEVDQPKQAQPPAQKAASTTTLMIVETLTPEQAAQPTTTTSSSPPVATPSTKSNVVVTPAENKQPAATSGDDYQSLVLYHHNVHRQNHSVSDIKWNQGLADTALKTAKSCKWAHDTKTDGGGYGQNIAAGYSSKAIGSVISNGWYNSEILAFADYWGDDSPASSESFHMTQIVWKKTTDVGCATYDCSSMSNLPGSNIPPSFTVCNYSPPGNMVGAFGSNVLKPNGGPTISA